MDETAEIAEETAPTRNAGPLPGSRPWRPSVWGPMALLAAHAVFALLFNPIGANGPDSQALMGLLVGALFSQPMMCAWWAAWSTTPLVWRAPTGIAALVLMLLLISLREWEPTLALLYTIVGLAFWAVFAVLRWRTSWRLATADTARLGQDPAAETQFGIRFLMGWTTVVAALCVLAKAVSFSSGRMGPTALVILGYAVVYTLLVAPAPTAVQLVLAGNINRRKVLAVALVTVACVVGSATLATTIDRGPGFREALKLFFLISLGGIAGGAASAVVLRWSGYRMVREVT